MRKARQNTECITGSQSQSSAHICDNGENGHPVEDFLPGSDAVGLCCHRTSELSGELPGVHPDLDHVVDECQERCQGEGGDKQRDETKLDHCDTERSEVDEQDKDGNGTICRTTDGAKSVFFWSQFYTRPCLETIKTGLS